MTDGLLWLAASLSALAGACLGLAAVDGWIWAWGRRASPRLPLVRRVVPWLRAVWVPNGLRWRWSGPGMDRRLRMAGLPWPASEFAAVRWLTLWAGLGLGGAAAHARRGDLLGWFLAGVLAVAGLAGPPTWLSLRCDMRQRELDRSLPDFLDRLSLALEAGLGFEIALRRAAGRFPGRLGEELRRMIRQIDRGHSRRAALEEMAERNPSEDLAAFAAAIRQADRLGTSLAKSLRVQSGLQRDRRRRRAQEAGRRLPVLIVFPLVFFFLPALLIIYLAPPLLHLFLGR